MERLVTDAACAQRLHDLAWQCQRGEFAAVRRLLEAQGRHVMVDGEGQQLTVQGPPCTVGILAGTDPLSCYHMLVFALFGMWWPYIEAARQGCELLKKTWQAQMRERRRATRGAP